MSSVDYCIEHPLAAFLYNVQDVYSALAELKNFDKKPKLVYVSTDEVGGQLPYHHAPWHPEVGRKSGLDVDISQVITHNPRNPYSASKAAAEMLVKGMCTQYGIPYAITRCVNNFGHNQGGGKFIPNIVDAIENDRPIPIRGSSVEDVNEHYRCWVAVEQHCAAVLETGYRDINGEVRHVPGDKLRNIDLIKTISEQLGKPYKLALSPAREAHDIGYQLHDITYSECVTPGTIHNYFRTKKEHE
jgi:dTDP-glucose 4,6-dehydratase